MPAKIVNTVLVEGVAGVRIDGLTGSCREGEGGIVLVCEWCGKMGRDATIWGRW